MSWNSQGRGLEKAGEGDHQRLPQYKGQFRDRGLTHWQTGAMSGSSHTGLAPLPTWALCPEAVLASAPNTVGLLFPLLEKASKQGHWAMFECLMTLETLARFQNPQKPFA